MSGSGRRSRFALLFALSRRGAAANRDLTFVDHETAHGNDVVGRYVGVDPQCEVVSFFYLSGNVTEVAQFFDEQFLVLFPYAP